ncbi:MAG: hypothetical protein RMY33_018420 [Nostoc sp. DedQUE03]
MATRNRLCGFTNANLPTHLLEMSIDLLLYKKCLPESGVHQLWASMPSK